MILPFKTYIEQRKVEKQTKNKVQARLFINRAERRLAYVDSGSISQDSAEFAYEDIYESIRESAQALMAQEGYKPLSHEATIAFLMK